MQEEWYNKLFRETDRSTETTNGWLICRILVAHESIDEISSTLVVHKEVGSTRLFDRGRGNWLEMSSQLVNS